MHTDKPESATPSQPMLDLILESDLLDIEVRPSGLRGGFLVGVTAKTLAGSSRVYALALRHGTRAVDELPSNRDELWVSVDGQASLFLPEGTDFGSTLDGLPGGDREDVLEAVIRLHQLHVAASRMVAEHMTDAQGHVYSHLNRLASQAGTVYPAGAGPETWHDSLEGFIRLCRTPGLRGVALTASPEGASLVNAVGRITEDLTGTTFDVAATWIGAADDGPGCRVTVDGASVVLAEGEWKLGGLFQGVPQGSREGLTESLLRLVKLADLAGEVVLAHRMGALGDADGEAGDEALVTLVGLARLHTGA